MASRTQVYVCELCGNIVEVLEGTDGTLTCCVQDMTLQKEDAADAAKEKHVPTVTINGAVALVQVGSVAHPMTQEHNIVWIELQQGDRVQRVNFKTDDAPQAEFAIVTDVPVVVRIYCNRHGLWKF